MPTITGSGEHMDTRTKIIVFWGALLLSAIELDWLVEHR
jgi:hypothetical protein